MSDGSAVLKGEAAQVSARVLPNSLAPGPITNLLELPCELIERIYGFHFATTGGYVYDLRSGKLRQANGQPIDLSLMYTCKKVYEQLSKKAVFFEVNPMTFRSACSNDYPWLSADWFHYLYRKHIQRQHSLLVRPDPTNDFDGLEAGTINVARLLPIGTQGTQGIYDTLCNWYPVFRPFWSLIYNQPPSVQFVKAFDRVKRSAEDKASHGRGLAYRHSFLYDLSSQDCDWGEVPSVKREAVSDFLLLHTGFNGPQDDVRSFFEEGVTTSETALVAAHPDCQPEPWLLPTKVLCRRLCTLLKIGMRGLDVPELWDEEANFDHNLPRSGDTRRHIRSYVSAAAQCIDFVNNILHPKYHCSLRQIDLREDHPGVAHPECHALGLIPITQANPHVRFKRYANLFKTILLTPPGGGSDPERMRLQAHSQRGWFLDSHRVTRKINAWTSEARRLPAAGMPEKCFQLVIDGDEAPRAAFKMFRGRVQRDLAHQLALEQCMKPGEPLHQLMYLEQRRCCMYISEDFPAAMRDLMDSGPDSLVRCNFGVGSPWDVGKIVAAYEGQSLHDWMVHWHYFGSVEGLGPTLPTWQKLVEDTFFM